MDRLNNLWEWFVELEIGAQTGVVGVFIAILSLIFPIYVHFSRRKSSASIVSRSIANSQITASDGGIVFVGDVVIGKQPIGDDLSATTVHKRSVNLLPADLSDFEGRIAQVEEFKDLLLGGGLSPVVAIEGMGGVGKSALALHVAHQIAGAAPDGCVFIDLGGKSEKPLTPQEAMEQVVRALTHEIPCEPNRIVETYRLALDGKRTLLLLDNVADSAQIKELIEWRADTTMVLVTSRNALPIPGIVAVDLPVMDSTEAKSFLRSTLRKRALEEKDLEVLADRCGCLPLALRVASTFLDLKREWSIEEYIQSLEDEKQRICDLFKIPEDPSLDVYSTLLLSAIELDRATRKNSKPFSFWVLRFANSLKFLRRDSLLDQWRKLSVFRRSFDLRAVSAIWGVEEETALSRLSELRQRSMLLYDDVSRRWHLHDLMKDATRLPLCAETESSLGRLFLNARRQHAIYFGGVQADIDRLITSRPIKDTYSQIQDLFRLHQADIDASHKWVFEIIQRQRKYKRLVTAQKLYDIGQYALAEYLSKPDWKDLWIEASMDVIKEFDYVPMKASTLENFGVALMMMGEIPRGLQCKLEAGEMAPVIQRPDGGLLYVEPECLVTREDGRNEYDPLMLSYYAESPARPEDEPVEYNSEGRPIRWRRATGETRKPIKGEET